jgi:cytochrome b561
MADVGSRATEPDRYGTVARAFHWGTSVAVVIMIVVGILMTSEPLGRFADPLYIVHKGLGTLLLLVVVLRVAWRLTHPAPPLPESVPTVQRRLMGVTHFALYALLVIMTVSGYVRTVGDGFPIELLDTLGIPTLLPRMPEAAAVALVTHQVAAYALTALVAVHVGAAVHDALIDRKGVFQRMWPF